MSTAGDLTANTATEAPCSDSEDSSKKLTKLHKKYAQLLTSTAKLLQRTSKRQKSNKDLERTVKYLRALYNQIKPRDHGKETDFDQVEDVGEEMDDEVKTLLNKTVFMVEDDRHYRLKKRQRRDDEIGKAKMDLWAKWQKQRARLEMMEAAAVNIQSA